MAADSKLNRTVLALYLSLILISQIFVSVSLCLSYLIVGSILVITFSFIVSPFILKFFSKLNINDEKHFKMSARKQKLMFYGIPFLIMLVYYFTYYPGGFIHDTLAQYGQYTTGVYYDWHPALHTFFAFILPLKLTGGWVGSIVLFQILVMTASLGYFFDTIHEYAGKLYVILSMVYILVNPLFAICVNPWKDTTFAVGAMLLMTFALRIYMTSGEWIKKPVHIVVFVIVFVATTIFRHNGILFTAPLMLALLFQMSKKRFVCLVLACIALFGVIKGPFYTAMGVERQTERRMSEMIGVPLNVICSAVTYTPELVDQDILDFAYEIAPHRIWGNYYEYGNINIIKWNNEDEVNKVVNFDIVDNYEVTDILGMMFRCFRESPYVCGRSFVKLTESVYTITDDHYAEIVPYIDDNWFKIGDMGVGIHNYLGLDKPATTENAMTIFFFTIRGFVKDYCPHLFLYYGVAVLLVIISVCSKSRLGKLKDWKKILFAIPLLAYNFGTALLMSGYNDGPRYFYITVLVVPILLIFFYRKEVKTE